MQRFRRSLNRIIVLVIIAFSAGCSTAAEPEEQESLEIVTVARGDLSTNITATGSVYPKEQVALSFDVGGRLSELLIQTGDTIVRGELLAKLDTADLELQVRSAEAGVAAAQAQLAQLLEGPQPEEIAAAEGQVAAAQAAVSQAVAARDQLQAGTTEADIAAAQAQVAAAAAEQKAALNLHDRTMECRTVQLPDGTDKRICPTLGDPEEEARFGLMAADEALSAAQAQLDAVTNSADARLRNSNAAVWAAVAQRDVAQAQLDLLSVKATDAQVAAAEANITQAEIALDTARLALERAELRSPIDGVVASVAAKPGEIVAPQSPIIVVADNQHFEVRGNIDEADIGRLGIGKDVSLTLDAFPGQMMTGHISVIAPTATFDAGLVSYEVTVEINATEVALRDGMTANMDIIREQREGVLVVPNRAIWIDSDSGRQFVEKQAGDGIAYVYVEQGVTNELFSEILSGLEEGDKLIVRSSSVRDRFRDMMTASMTGNTE